MANIEDKEIEDAIDDFGNTETVNEIIAEPREAMVPSINVLNSSNLIKQEDVKFLQDHKEGFEKRFRTRGLFRSKLEMEAGVLNNDEHPTPDSKYWQAIGEQNVHLTELISLNFEAQKLAADTELLSAEIEELEDSLSNEENVHEKKKTEAKLKRKKIEFEQNKFNLMQQEKTAQERMREVKTWEGIIENLIPQLKHGDEDFGVHHAERYFLRYQRRMERLQMMDQATKESVVTNYLAFASHPDNKELVQQITGNPAPNTEHQLPQPQSQPVPRIEATENQPPVDSCQVDYENANQMMEDDPIAQDYFNRKVRTLVVAAPHRNKDDRNATNFFGMQTPTGFNCNITEPYGYTVPDARNLVVEKAIEEGIDYIFFVDDDVIIPRTALVQLIHHKADIVGGFYYKKYLPLESVGMHVNDKNQPVPIEDFEIGDVIHNTLILPSGCTLIKVEMLKNIERPWYKSITIKGRPAITEDTYLCQKLHKAGIDIITDTGIQCIHVDYNKGIFYGHPEIVDAKTNSIREQYRDHFAI